MEIVNPRPVRAPGSHPLCFFCGDTTSGQHSLYCRFCGLKPTKWRRRYTPLPVALQGIATTPLRLFPQFAGVSQRHPPKGPMAPHPGPPCSTYLGSWEGGGGVALPPVGVSRVVWTSEALSRSRGWSSYTCERRATLRRPTMEPLSKNNRDFEASSLGILVFRGTFRPN